MPNHWIDRPDWNWVVGFVSWTGLFEKSYGSFFCDYFAKKNRKQERYCKLILKTLSLICKVLRLISKASSCLEECLKNVQFHVKVAYAVCLSRFFCRSPWKRLFLNCARRLDCACRRNCTSATYDPFSVIFHEPYSAMLLNYPDSADSSPLSATVHSSRSLPLDSKQPQWATGREISREL